MLQGEQWWSMDGSALPGPSSRNGDSSSSSSSPSGHPHQFEQVGTSYHHFQRPTVYVTTHDDEPGFRDHVNNLRSTMFYVCQGSCLCGTVNNRGKVIYCYGDLVPRHGELFAEGAETQGTTTSKDLLAAQLGIWTFGIIALLIVLLLIRKSIASLRRHLEKVTDRLPLYHDDDLLSNHSATSPPLHTKDTTMDTMVGHQLQDAEDPPELFSDDGTLTPDVHTDESPVHLGGRGMSGTISKATPTDKLKTLRLHRKDFKKGGDGLRGKNVTEAFRVKEKDMKRTMKWRTPEFSMEKIKSRKKKKHERTRNSRGAYYNNADVEKSGESNDENLDDYDEDEEEEKNSVYRRISERRIELNRARRNGDDCHVSWYTPNEPYENGNNDVLLINNDHLVAISSKERRQLSKV